MHQSSNTRVACVSYKRLRSDPLVSETHKPCDEPWYFNVVLSKCKQQITRTLKIESEYQKIAARYGIAPNYVKY